MQIRMHSHVYLARVNPCPPLHELPRMSPETEKGDMLLDRLNLLSDKVYTIIC